MSNLEQIFPLSPLVKDCDGDEEGGCGTEWAWEDAGGAPASISEDSRTVIFHPVFSVGTAAVRADTALLPAHHHYWEVRVLTDMYGTDVQVGVGTRAVPFADHANEFSSLLGCDRESYGLSYMGQVHAAGTLLGCTGSGFRKGALVGVLVDTWHGTLQFYVDREPHGPLLTGLRRDTALYPMISSTAARSMVRLTYASSRAASLQVCASRVLAGARHPRRTPPGLALLLRRCRPFPHERPFVRRLSTEQRRRSRSPARRRTSCLVAVGERQLVPTAPAS